ncbi:STAS domain-containing protein [Magnetofaba australis]|uniref:Putative anti-anti-sigma regulatory factor n=1 Tax=Magnetofaba australis IT-1 TaxID=1434232 RepID=A0A1Y2K7M2_9PROT|nr:STAS domain-containing protein [Magnetofaba australis]OSM05358.1 putative anti-anti-sigma regulatory factor [Magnetofaba australis IT-1]
MKIPILKQGHVLQIAFQDDMTDRDICDLQDDLLGLIKKRDAQGVLLDVSGLRTIDSFRYDVLVKTAAMARVMGCRSVICGLQPQVAISLIDMGINFGNVRTAVDLEHGRQVLGV